MICDTMWRGNSRSPIYSIRKLNWSFGAFNSLSLSCTGLVSLPLVDWWWCCCWSWGFCPVCPLGSAGWCMSWQTRSFSEVCAAPQTPAPLWSSCDFSRTGGCPKLSHLSRSSRRFYSTPRLSSFGFFRTAETQLLHLLLRLCCQKRSFCDGPFWSLLFWYQCWPPARLYWLLVVSPIRRQSGSCRYRSSDWWGTPWTTLPL